MAKALASVAKAAGAIALVAGAIATFNPGLAVAGISLAKIAGIASVIGTTALAGALILSKPPPPRPREASP